MTGMIGMLALPDSINIGDRLADEGNAIE